MDTVGIVGLGVMGSNCAKKLMESGVPVAGYDPYPPAVKRARYLSLLPYTDRHQ